jgi:hypothetical protein
MCIYLSLCNSDWLGNWKRRLQSTRHPIVAYPTFARVYGLLGLLISANFVKVPMIVLQRCIAALKVYVLSLLLVENIPIL